MKLEWTASGRTTDGRFSIHSDHVRGEDRACRAVHDSLGLAGDGAYDKRKVQRLAQRIADLVDKAAP